MTRRCLVDPSDDLDHERIVEVLDRYGVACIVVGGYGTQLHGASRATMDLDLVAELDRETSIDSPAPSAS